RRLSERHGEQEAVKETVTTDWRAAASYRPQRGRAAPWLYPEASNAIVDWMRTRLEPVADLPETASADPGPPERAESAEVAWRVHRALEDIPAKEREVLELAYWSGMSQSEVADYLNIPLGTVKTRTRS